LGYAAWCGYHEAEAIVTKKDPETATKALIKRFHAIYKTDQAAAKQFMVENSADKTFFEVAVLRFAVSKAFKDAFHKRRDAINSALNESSEFKRPMMESIVEDVVEEVRANLKNIIKEKS
jgi:hypothetical protein